MSYQIDERSHEEERLLGSDNQIFDQADKDQLSQQNQSSNLSIKEMRDDAENSFGTLNSSNLSTKEKNEEKPKEKRHHR